MNNIKAKKLTEAIKFIHGLRWGLEYLFMTTAMTRNDYEKKKYLIECLDEAIRVLQENI